ncbi:MAG: hypothetical protein BAJATHORv1_10098 [Candidatus Thorarchaeota archaeon]|nr:MAG: hypothetical protein BAJATHORv1_10098 [Candidatus Thorarchaeota archaeon]
MGIMRTAAAKGLIPAGNKISELRGNLTRLMTESAKVLEERFGQEGLDALSEVFRRLGSEDAEAMKKRLGLEDGLKDASDAWKVIGHVFGAKMNATWKSDGYVEFDHPFCPQHAEFQKQGKLFCDTVCLPYVTAVAEGIAPEITVGVVRKATEDSTCIKSLKLENVPSE